MLALGSVRWRKVWRDLFEHRIRSVLVVVSIAVGVTAVGTIAGANALLEANLRDGYAATQPSSASLFTTVPFDKDLVETVRRMPGVADAEGRRSATARLVTGPEESIEVQLTALEPGQRQTLMEEAVGDPVGNAGLAAELENGRSKHGFLPPALFAGPHRRPV